MDGVAPASERAWFLSDIENYGQTKLLIRNLPLDASEQKIKQLFEQVGSITDVQVFLPSMVNGQLVPAYGFVKYANPVSAQAAMTYLQGYPFSGHRLLLTWVRNAPSLSSNSTLGSDTPMSGSAVPAVFRPDTCLYSVFVGDLSPEIDDGVLTHAFSKFPSLYDARIIRDPKTQISRGFGFVRFRSESDAMESIATMSGQWLHGRNIRVNWAARPAEPMPPRMDEHSATDSAIHEQTGDTTTLYVGNLCPDSTLQDLMPIFSPYGNVINAQMFPGRHYAFITFQFHSSAMQALESLKHQPPKLSGQEIKVGPARYASRNSSNRR
ncbi:Similar to S.cerevisiae protein PAB1 (Poly(A) binding protein) [Malassezia sympodialis ATCC 42132]|uniref:Similar to S.cerevisiae protein PAB1 (Poly(A) binding protein) n=1 Tax=Malassezia sympodialis (strain ATCC 42132) TaxID=1230383 RepID=A0A1M8A4T5_MALS4|nr:Similar to S.cerevisiae protein PAB1 (Poly(A) binding protein) [Malassezia sympodialis ATCC 42132]